MLFQRKGKLRKEFNEKLIRNLEQFQNDWMKQKDLVEKCVDPPEEVLYHLKIAESKYFLVLREAKNRKVTLRK